MLVLTRKSGESIAIGDDVKVTVLEIKLKQVRLGIEAPQGTTVHREEIYQRILEENKMAALISTVHFKQIDDFWKRNMKR